MWCILEHIIILLWAVTMAYLTVLALNKKK